MRKLLAVVALVVGLVGGAMSTPSDQADAWVYGTRTGRPGTVRVPNATFIGMRHGNVWWCCWLVKPNTDGYLTVNRAPYRGRQNVIVAFVLQRAQNGGWQTVQQRLTTTWIRRGQRSVTVGQPSFEYLPMENPYGFYRMAYVIAWGNAWNRNYGTVTVLPHTTNDHWCGAALRCTLFNGYVHIRGFVTD